MDYGKIFGRAWQITKRWKALWVLGLLSIIGTGLIGSVNPSWIFEDNIGRALAHWIIPPEVIALLVMLSCLTLFLGIALWVISVIARGGLIAGVKQVAEKGETSFGSAWGEGASRFWTLFGIGVLMLIAFIVMVLFSGLFVGLIGLVLQALFSWSLNLWTAFVIGGLIGLVGGSILGLIRIYAEQAAVQEGLGWTDAFQRGWEVLKGNVGTTIVLLFFFMGIMVIVGIVALLLGVVLGIGVGASIWALLTGSNAGLMVVSLCCIGAFGIILVLALEGLFQAFTSATWTLAYRQMIDLDAAREESAEVEVSEAEPTEE